MANSRYEYVKNFEQDPILLPDCWVVARIDGQSFHKFTTDHNFAKPNDMRALRLMNRCAEEVFKKFQDVVFAIGMSDEYSFVLRRETDLYQRRSQKINSSIVSHFSSCYIFYWTEYMGADNPLKYLPSFDCRLVLYPTDRALRDYLSWRQVDCHINNLYNTCFWALVDRAGHSTRQAEHILKDTLSADKNELLFSKFGINYAHEEAMYRKGSIFVRHQVEEKHCAPDGRSFIKHRSTVSLLHEDIIQDAFWLQYPVIPIPPHVVSGKAHKRQQLEVLATPQSSSQTESSSASASDSSSTADHLVESLHQTSSSANVSTHSESGTSP